jgi:hypothetical protein
LPSGTLDFAAGQTSKTITVQVAGDTIVEGDESFTVQLANASAGAITGASASGLILDDDVAPQNTYLSISASNADRLEGNSGSTAFLFTVTRSGDTTGTTTVSYSVAGQGTNAASASDFAGVLPGGSVSFTAGEVSKTISIQVAGDALVESDEGFSLQLLNPGGAQITTGTANGMIRNDDVPPTPGISVTPISGLTTKENGSSASFNVVLDSQPTSDVAIDVVSLDTSEGVVSTSRLVFTAANWNVAQTVKVTGVDDKLRDGDVAYTIQLTAAASNAGPYAGIDPDDVRVTNQDNERGPRRRGSGPTPGNAEPLDAGHPATDAFFNITGADARGHVMDLDAIVHGGDRGGLGAALDRYYALRHATEDHEEGMELLSEPRSALLRCG